MAFILAMDVSPTAGSWMSKLVSGAITDNLVGRSRVVGTPSTSAKHDNRS